MDGGTTESTGGGRSTLDEGLGSLERWWNASGIALWSFVLFGAFLLNATLLLAFLKRPGLRTISNRFVMNLTVSNLLTCAILNPLLMMDTASSSSTSSTPSTACSIAESATALVTTSSVLSVLLIALDQYLAVVDPLRYRTRIDKLKCGILVVSVWLISGVFGLLAGLNPSPRSLWLVCETRENARYDNYSRNETFNVTIDASFRLILNTSDDYESDFSITELNDNLSFIDNTTSDLVEQTITHNLETLTSANITLVLTDNFVVTYGLVYAITYAIFAYLLPFVGVCWFYVSIYSAAHKNSERTRRTGSRPVLSTGSEEYYPVRQDLSNEDFRRIPKISSLSSIDESIETHTPSQIMPSRRSSELIGQTNNQETSNETIEEEETSAVIFTVGSSKVDVKSQQQQQYGTTFSGKRPDLTNTKDNNSNDNNKVPIAVLKAQFLGNSETGRSSHDDYVKSKFRDEPTQKRKSSHDLMYEEMLRVDFEKLRLAADNCNDEDSSDNEENANEANFSITAENRDSEIDQLEDSIIRIISYDSTIAEAIPENKILHVNQDRGISENNREIDISLINDGTSTRKNSLDDSNNLPSQSSILKNQNSFSNGKWNSRYGVQRNEGAFNYDEIYGKTSMSDSHIFGCSPPIVTITPPNKSSLHRVSSTRSTSSYINSLKHRISNGSLFKYREETRAARISALVIVMGLICWTPYVIVLVLKNINSLIGKKISHESDIAAACFLILAAYVSPLLFGYRSRRVKRELRKFFCFRKELSYKNNRSLMAKKVLKRRHSGNISQLEMDARYNIFNCVYGRTKWPKDKVHFVQVPETALVVETCRSSFSSGASTQISSTSTEEC